MLAALQAYRRYEARSFLLFLVFLVLAIATRESWLLLIPFALIILPPIIKFSAEQPVKWWWLLIALLPLSTELNVTPTLGLDFPDEPLLIGLTAIALVKCIHQPGWFPRSVSVHPLFFLLMIYLGWIFITCLCAIDTWPAFKYLLAKLWYIVPFVTLAPVLLSSKEAIRKMAILLLVPMLFVVMQALVRHAWFGFSFQSIKYMLKPFFRNHVNYSSMLVCLLAVGWGMWRLTPATSSRRKWIGWGLMIGLAGLFFAYSRGAWIALLAGAITIWLIKTKQMFFALAIAVIAIVISTAWLITDQRYMKFAPDHDRTIFHPDFGEHMAATVNMKDISTAERFYRWVAGAKMLGARPITGFGPNSFYNHYRPYTVRRFETWVSDNPEHSTVHNYFILVALEQGLPGLILFSLLYFGMLIHAQRLYHQLHDPFYKTVALVTGIVLVMIGAINFMSDMIETDKIGSLFWLGLGVMVMLEEKRKLKIQN